MRLLLAQLAPVVGDVAANLERLEAAVTAAPSDLAIFPELFLTGYRLGDRIHGLALPADGAGEAIATLRRVARASATPIAVGAPVASAERPGEVENAAVLVDPSGAFSRQAKRYLPNFGPFEEGLAFSPTGTSRPVTVGAHRVGLEICYDAFFPEITRELALGGAALLANLSASPVTSRPLFERLLPARAIENGCPTAYVNRVGVEDGLVFGGGSGAWNHRGEGIVPTTVPFPGLAAEERLLRVDVDLDAAARGRPFRPVLRDVAARPGAVTAPGAELRSGRGARL